MANETVDKKENKPEVICCGALEQLTLGWMKMEDGTKIMPYINNYVNGQMYRVNYCPSCGKYVRDAEIKP